MNVVAVQLRLTWTVDRRGSHWVIDRSRHEHAARRRTGGCDRRLLGEAVRREQGNLLVDFARSQADGTLAALSEGHSDTEN